jgi:hypothetical protein
VRAGPGCRATCTTRWRAGAHFVSRLVGLSLDLLGVNRCCGWKGWSGGRRQGHGGQCPAAITPAGREAFRELMRARARAGRRCRQAGPGAELRFLNLLAADDRAEQID